MERLRAARDALPAPAAARLDALLRRSPTAASAEAATSAASALDGLFLDESNTVALFKRCAPSVVHIRTSAVARTPFSQNVTEIPQGAGTGILWDLDGHIVTNFHVIKARNATATTPALARLLSAAAQRCCLHAGAHAASLLACAALRCRSCARARASGHACRTARRVALLWGCTRAFV